FFQISLCLVLGDEFVKISANDSPWPNQKLRDEHSTLTLSSTSTRPWGLCADAAVGFRKPSYVAKIERIEADSRGSNVKVHVRWYYRPEESIGGRRQFHGSKEVFLSDHHDVQSADTIEAKCTVHTFKSYTKLDAVGNDDFFCRFEYNSSTGAFNPDRVAVYCKCEMPYNPDDLMVQCEGCSDCLGVHAVVIHVLVDEIVLVYYSASEFKHAWARFHPACIDMNAEEAKRLDHFFCEGCSSEGQKKLQNSHTASKHPDTKVDTKRRRR
ncbi:PHD finger family protein / bromo-adjacent homology domain-containing protein, partial [Prunus dulcis]